MKFISIVIALAIAISGLTIPIYADTTVSESDRILVNATNVTVTSFGTYKYSDCTNTNPPNKSGKWEYVENLHYYRCSLHTGTYSDGSTRYCDKKYNSYKCLVCGAEKTYEVHETGYYSTFFYDAYGTTLTGCEGYIKGYQCPYCNQKFGTTEPTNHACRYVNGTYGYEGTESTFYAYYLNTSAGTGCTLTTNRPGAAAEGASVTFSVTKPGARKAVLNIDGTEYELTTTSTSASKSFTMPAKAVTAYVEYDWLEPEYTGEDISYEVDAGTVSAPITTTSNGTKTYSSSNEAVATIDSSTGEMTIVGPGTTIITLSTASSTTTKAGSKSVTVSVSKKTPEFTGSDITKSYGDISFSSGLEMTNGDGTVSYDSSNESVATIDSTGNVTILSGGTTNLSINSAETEMYNAGTKTVTLTVNRIASTTSLNSITKTYGDASFNLSYVTTGDGVASFTSSNTAVATVDTSGKVTIKGAGSSTITVNVAQGTNYNASSGQATITVNKATPVVNSLTASPVTYGQALSDSNLTHTASVPGTVAWQTPSIKPAVSDSNVTSYTVIFTPNDTANYNTVTKTVKLTVNKQTPSFTPEQLATVKATGITYGQSLANSTLTGTGPVPGTFTWQDSTIKPTVADSNTTKYNVVFTPTDTVNYTTKVISTTLTVNKQTPTFTAEQLATVKATGITYGQSLASSTLTGTGPVPGTFTWQDSTIKPTVADSNTTKYNVVFTPNDTDNYTTKVVTATVGVTKQTPSFTPEQLATVTASGITYGQSLANSTLTGTGPVPGTFTWQDSTIKPTVADSNKTKYNVVFTPNDTDNYTTKVITTTVEVTKQTPSFTPEQLSSVTASGITYGQSLASSTLTGTGPVPGTFAWQDSTIKPTVADSNTTNYNVVFTPNDIVNYNTKTIQVKLSVAKATPTVDSLSASGITYGQSLSDSTLTHTASVPGNVTWQTPSIRPVVSDSNTTNYTVIFTPNDTANYNTVSKTVSLDVTKQTPTFTPEQLSSVRASAITYGQSLSNSVLVGSSPIPGTFTWEDGTIKPSVADSNTTNYNVVFTPADTVNYNTQTMTATVEVIKATPVVTNATASSIVYGQSLSDSSITFDSSVPGTVNWKDGSIKPPASNSTNYDAVFTPNDTANYNSLELSISLEVKKAIPVVSNVSATAITYGQSLADSTLTFTASVPGTVSWTDSSIKPTVADSQRTSYYVIFIPTDSANYESVAMRIPLTVNKAIPSITSLSASQITYGQSLADSTLTFTASIPGTIDWADSTIKPTVADSERTEYTVIFTPNSSNYSTITGKTKLKVIKQTPLFTEEQLNTITATGITYGESLADSTITGDSPIPGDFSWKDDTIKPSVPDSETTEYEVVFVPTDTENYNETELKLTLKVSKANPVISSLSASAITYGQSLSDSTITISASVPGSTVWETPTVKPTVVDSDKTEYYVVFTPSDTVNYNAVKAKTTLVIYKKDPPFTTTQGISASGITYGQSLSNSTITGTGPIPGSFSWVDGTIKPVVADSNTTRYNVVFTPDDTVNYNTYNFTLTLSVAKATPVVNITSTGGITYEQSLSDSTIEYTASVLGSIAWEDDTIKPTVPDSNKNYNVVFTPTDTDNYETVVIEAPIQVAKATPDVDISATDITYGQTLNDSKLTASLSGDVTWYARQGSADTIRPTVADSNNTYYRVLFTPIDTVNYNTVTKEIQITVNKQTPSITEQQITAAGITYGQALKDSVLTGDSPVPGTFVWQDNTIKPTVADSNTTKYNVVFTPDDTDNYTTKVIQITLDVEKATPTVLTLTALGIVYGQSLSDSTLTHTASVPGTVVWEDDGITPSVTDSDVTGYSVVFTPNDTANYNTVVTNTTINVIKATPTINTLSASDIIYEQSLADSTLTHTASIPGSVAWEDDSIKPLVSDSEITEYEVLFTPDDTDNYNTVSLITTIKVSKCTPTIEGALQTTEIVYGEELKKSTITGTASVEGTFEWKAPDTKPSVTDSNNTPYDVVFKPTDRENYNDVELTAYIKVLKADVIFTTEQLDSITATEITYGQTLDNSIITGESPIVGKFEWVNPSDIPSVNDNTRQCKFIPDDVNNYNEFELNLTVPVKKADPEISEVTGSTITYGQKLKDSEITGVYDGELEWKEPDTMPVASTSNKYTAIFTPTDTDNYNIIEVEVPVIVNKASVNISVKDIEKIYGEDPFSLGATSVGTITYTSEMPEILEIDGNKGIIKSAGIATVTATAYLNDNYETATASFKVVIKKAIPEIKSVYAERSLVYGETLSDISLKGEATVPGSFKWTNEEYSPMYSDNGLLFSVTFIPDNSSYETITKDIELTVVQKDPEIPEEEILVLTSTKLVYGQSLKHSTIVGERRYPGEYEWYEPDTIPNVSDSNVTKYPVVFVPDDNNYATVIIGALTVEVEKAQADAPEESIVKDLDEGEFKLTDSLESDGVRVYRSSDISVATVDSNGIVTPVRKGEADITVTALETDNYKECSQVYHLTVMYSAPPVYGNTVSRPSSDRTPVSNDSDIEDDIDEDDNTEPEEDNNTIDNTIKDDNKTPTSIKTDDLCDENVPTGVALGGIGTLITSLIAMAIFKKRR